jgi:predicted ribosome-associated RNA-binding protein Tma20
MISTSTSAKDPPSSLTGPILYPMISTSTSTSISTAACRFTSSSPCLFSSRSAAKIVDTYPKIAPYMEELVPKKSDIRIAKCADGINLLVIDGVPKFFNYFNGAWIPTLRTLHQCPLIMKRLRTDAGAIKFVLSGADIMCQGKIILYLGRIYHPSYT